MDNEPQEHGVVTQEIIVEKTVNRPFGLERYEFLTLFVTIMIAAIGGAYFLGKENKAAARDREKIHRETKIQFLETRLTNRNHEVDRLHDSISKLLKANHKVQSKIRTTEEN